MATHSIETSEGRLTAHKLDAIGWGLFFIWVGLAVLVNLGWGAGLVGVGILVIGGQLARKYTGLTFEGFWALVGACFVIGGLWELFSVHASLIPILCIAAGVALVVSALLSKPRE